VIQGFLQSTNTEEISQKKIYDSKNWSLVKLSLLRASFFFSLMVPLFFIKSFFEKGGSSNPVRPIKFVSFVILLCSLYTLFSSLRLIQGSDQLDIGDILETLLVLSVIFLKAGTFILGFTDMRLEDSILTRVQMSIFSIMSLLLSCAVLLLVQIFENFGKI
jgi:hypothetical protein